MIVGAQWRARHPAARRLPVEARYCSLPLPPVGTPLAFQKAESASYPSEFVAGFFGRRRRRRGFFFGASPFSGAWVD